MKNNNVRKLTTISMLIAMEVVLSRFVSINAWNVKIGFSFVPVAITGMLYGPLTCAVMAAISDVIGATLFPNGPFFIGFTITAALHGLMYGLFLHKKRELTQIVPVVLINQLIFSLLLNTYWIVIMYHSSFAALLTTRFMQSAYYIPVQIVTIYALRHFIEHINK